MIYLAVVTVRTGANYEKHYHLVKVKKKELRDKEGLYITDAVSLVRNKVTIVYKGMGISDSRILINVPELIE